MRPSPLQFPGTQANITKTIMDGDGMNPYLEKIKADLAANPPDYGDAHSILEMLYDCCNEYNGFDKQILLFVPSSDKGVIIVKQGGSIICHSKSRHIPSLMKLDVQLLMV